MSKHSGLWDSPRGCDGYATSSRTASGPTEGTAGCVSSIPTTLGPAPALPASAPTKGGRRGRQLRSL
eukprot:13340831-Alexandrium_andersonii.AAC.1